MSTTIPEPDTARPTRIRVERVGDRLAAAELTPGSFLVPRLLDIADGRARVGLVGHSATLLIGDHLALQIEVGADAHLDIVEPSGTVAYNARGGHASWSARVRVGPGGSFRWRAAPFVVAGGAEVTRQLDIDLADGSRALLAETLILGRSNETGGALLSHQRVRYAAAPLLIETLDLRCPTARSRPGLLGRHRVIGTVMLLGDNATVDTGEHTTPLAGPGSLLRVLTDQAHEAELAMEPAWTQWAAAFAGAPPR